MVITVEKDAAAGGEAALLLERSRAITVQGRDRKGRDVVRVVGSYFPARALGGRAEEALRAYLRERVLPAIGDREFVVVYMHSRVDRGGNFPGVGAIRGAYESLPAAAKDRLRAVYFVHPALQSRLFLATFGRFLFSSGLYEKLRYMSRLEYMWVHMDKGQLEVPDCVLEHDEELERRPLMDYGIEATESRCVYEYDAASMDTSASLHSLRCVS
ncbi:ganglioside-induced differentiation-associated protein 2-like [Panicum virgatum]|uniref:ganglioside-induced differentiation-associated protein 2-like n=1 Tax=Panicum virgatum TaxID=38727 RepID=UPI0019D679C9|nr:ganglioside-induced differentiation-associated protein 2-like [Panicum virgatum]